MPTDRPSYVELRTNDGGSLRVSPLSNQDVEDVAVVLKRILRRDGKLNPGKRSRLHVEEPAASPSDGGETT